MSAFSDSYSPKELEILVEITQILTGTLPFAEKCESGLQLLADFTDSDVVSLREFNPETSSFDLIACFSPLTAQKDLQIPLSVTTSLSATAMAEKSPVVVNDYRFRDQHGQTYETLGMKSAVAVPVYIDGELFGTLGFGSKSLNHYDGQKFEVVAAVTSVVGMMIAKADLQQTNDVEASIGRIISMAPVGAGFFESFTTELRKVIAFDRVTLNSVDVAANTFVTEFLFGNQIPNFPAGESRDVGGTVIEEVIRSRTGQCLRFDGADGMESKFPRARPFIFDGLPYFLCIPLIVGDQIIGTMGIIRGSVSFSQKDLVKATRLGNLVAGVFADYKQKEFTSQAEREIQNSRKILEVEANIGRIVSEPLIGPDVFERFAAEAAKLIDFEGLSLNSTNIIENTYVTEFLMGTFVPDYTIGATLEISGTALEKVVRSRSSQRYQLEDREEMEANFPAMKPFIDAGQVYLIGVPFIVGDQVVGSMGILRSSRPFSQEDQVSAERLGNLIAGAFADYKQQQYRVQTEQVIARNNAITEAEAKIGRILSAPLRKACVSEALKSAISGVIPLEKYVILSLDLEAETFRQDNNAFSYDPALIVANNPGQTYVGSITGEAVRTGTTQIINSDDPRIISGEMPLSQMVFEQGYQSLMAVPLRFEGEIIGTFICSRRDGVYLKEDVVVGERIGSLLAGALATFEIISERDRARLERAESETRYRAILEAEVNIGRLLSSPVTGSSGFNSLRMEFAKIIPLDRYVILRVDTEAETFSQESIDFLYDPSLILANNPGQTYLGSITGEVVRTRTAQIIHSDDPRLAAGDLPITKMVFDKGYQSILGVPLVFDGKIIGIFACSRYEGRFDEEDLVTAGRIGSLLAGAVATFNITYERNQAQLALLESDSRFRQIADSIGGVFWLVELTPHRLIYASPNAENVWDMPLPEIYEDFGAIFRNIHPDDVARIQRDSIGADKTGFLDIEYRVIKRDGSVAWIRSRGFPILGPDGELVRMSGFAEDITEHKMELERITEAGRLVSIGELASGVAHEINNPLAAINLYSEALLDLELPTVVTDDIKVISAQGKRAANIVRNLLQFSRKSIAEVTTVQALEFIESCVDLKRHDFRVNNISSSISVLLDQPEIAIDKQLMTQVMVNILSNAEQACIAARKGGKISISVREAEGSTRISVSDDGPGIPTDILTKVFDPFFTTKGVGEGTGLGLSVSYGIITQLGGNLWVESDGVSGTTFHIDVPRKVAEQPVGLKRMGSADEEVSDDAYLPESGSTSLAHVLVIDDEQVLREVVVKILEQKGYTTQQAGDGEAALVKLQEGSFDCILLDLRMPGMGGQELFQRITTGDPETAAKVVFVTGDLTNEGTREFLEPLNNRVLSKPVSIQEFEDAIGLVISARRDMA